MQHQARILLVEDEPLVSETIANALGEVYQVVVAEDAADAGQRLREGGFAAMLLDCLLPGGKAAEVGAEADRRGVPVVLMSGDPGQIDTLVGGQRPFLSKPFTIEQLFAAVQQAVG